MITRYKAEERLKSVGRGRNSSLENMLRVMKGDIYRLLTNYMYLSAENLSVYADVTRDGEYILNVKATTERFIDSGKIL